jgi:uncharacterized membrane protein
VGPHNNGREATLKFAYLRFMLVIAMRFNSSMMRDVLPALVVSIVLHIIINPESFCLMTDEAFSWRVASTASISSAIAMTARDVHPPLYYVFLWLWVHIFGDQVVVMRALSGLFSLGAVLAVYGYASSWAHTSDKPDNGAARLAALFVALCPPQVAIAHLARMYSLMSLLAVLAAWALLEAIRQPERWRFWVGYVVAATALIYTHNYGLYFVAGQACWVLWEAGFSSDRDSRRLLWWRGAFAFGIVGLLYLPWLPRLAWQASKVSGNYWIVPLKWDDLASLPLQLVSRPMNELPSLASPIAGLLMLVSVAILFPWRRSSAERQQVAIVAAHVVAIIGSAALLGRSVFVPRYLVYLMPLIPVPVAYWLSRIKRDAVRHVVVAYCLFVVSYMLVYEVWAFLPFSTPSADIRSVTEVILSKSQPDEPVIATDRAEFLLLQYYVGRQRPTQAVRLFDKFPSRSASNHVVFDSAILDENFWVPDGPEAARTHRFWVVSVDPSDLGPPAGEPLWEKNYFLPAAIGYSPGLRVVYSDSGSGDRSRTRGEQGGELR